MAVKCHDCVSLYSSEFSLNTHTHTQLGCSCNTFVCIILFYFYSLFCFVWPKLKRTSPPFSFPSFFFWTYLHHTLLFVPCSTWSTFSSWRRSCGLQRYSAVLDHAAWLQQYWRICHQVVFIFLCCFDLIKEMMLQSCHHEDINTLSQSVFAFGNAAYLAVRVGNGLRLPSDRACFIASFVPFSHILLINIWYRAEGNELNSGLLSCRYKEVCPYPDSTFTEVTKYLDIPETLLTDFTPGSAYHIEVGSSGIHENVLFTLILCLTKAVKALGNINVLS